MGIKKDVQLLLTFAVSSTTAAIALGLGSSSTTEDSIGIFRVTFAIGAFFVALATVDILRYRPADSHTIYTLIGQYWYILRMRMTFIWASWELHQTSVDCKKYQEQALLRILRTNETTEYGLDNNLQSYRSREEFVDKYPFTSYEDYKGYVDKIASGGENVLTRDKVVFLGTTSGTTGKNKIFPLTDSYTKAISWKLRCLHSMNNMFYNLRRVHQFRLALVDRFSACGLPLGGAGIITQSPSSFNLVPLFYTKMYEEDQSYFTQSLFLLAERELGYILGYSSNLLYTLFKYMEHHWEELCNTIETGNLDETAPIDEGKRSEFNLRGDPSRADELRRELKAGIKGLAPRIWKELDFVMVAKTGSFAHCAELLAETYLKDVPQRFVRHGSTEGFYGFQGMEDLGSEIFTLIPDVCFLEFIKTEDADSVYPKTYFMEQLELGETYEIVTTSPHGVYRFRIGDVIKIIGFYNSLPRYTFQYRMGQRLNIAFDRTPEDRAYMALQRAVKRLPPGVVLADYTSTESFMLDRIKGERLENAWYVFFLEVMEAGKERPLPADFELQLDQELCAMHEPYGMYRNKGNIAPLQVIQVHGGTFDQLKRLLWGDYQNSQFKQPRVQRRENLLRFLIEQQM